MTTAEKVALKEAITRKIIKTESDILEYKELSQPVAPDVAIGRITRMDAINNKSVAEAALREAENKLIRLKNALSNIEHHDFGICIKCHAEIPFKRLLIMPESIKCVKCSM